MDNKIIKTKEVVTIKECRAQVACMLNELWHSRLPIIHWSNVVRNTHYACYAIYCGDLICGVGIWSSPVAQNRFKNGKELLELRRLAIADDAPKFTATMSISYMQKDIKNKFPDIKKLISYQDVSVHTGTIYKASNWVIGAETGFIDWSTKTRKRNTTQSDAPKIRWEYDLESRRKYYKKLSPPTL